MELFKAKLGSPVTQLAENITSTQTTISLVNADVLPAPPNIATIGTGVNAETIRYSGKTLNTLTGVTRGFTGTAKAWTSGQSIARIFTQYDHDSVVESVETHLAENVSQRLSVSRDVSLLGSQVISTLNKPIKSMQIVASINNKPTRCFSQFSKNEGLQSQYIDGTANTVGFTTGIIFSDNNRADRVLGTVVVNLGGITINWSILSGTGLSGTAYIDLLIHYHGE